MICKAMAGLSLVYRCFFAVFFPAGLWLCCGCVVVGLWLCCGCVVVVLWLCCGCVVVGLSLHILL